MHQFPKRILGITTLFFGLFMIGFNLPLGYAQTSLPLLKERVVGLEKKLVEANTRQEDAHRVQKELERYEKELATLTTSEKYKTQIIAIQSKIEAIRARIAAIVKDREELEEKLRTARVVLNNARSVNKLNTNSPVYETKDKYLKNHQPDYWKFKKINIGSYFNINENNEIMKIFSKDYSFSKNDLLKGAYHVYTTTGTVIKLKIYKNQHGENLDILLDQRMDPNSNSYFTYIPSQTLDQFKENHFDISIDR